MSAGARRSSCLRWLLVASLSAPIPKVPAGIRLPTGRCAGPPQEEPFAILPMGQLAEKLRVDLEELLDTGGAAHDNTERWTGPEYEAQGAGGGVVSQQAITHDDNHHVAAAASTIAAPPAAATTTKFSTASSSSHLVQLAHHDDNHSSSGNAPDSTSNGSGRGGRRYSSSNAAPAAGA